MEITIEVKDLKKFFKDNKVLKDVEFEVQKGEIFALLGSNGSGKTTIVRILSTLLKSDGGTAKICGYDVNKNPEKVRENISLTGQFTAVDSILTGKENLILVAKLRGAPNPEKVADDLLRQFDLVKAANKRSDTYSGGMRRRLDIAMSLIGNPAVIFLDEPTTGLDPEGRFEVWKTIEELAKGGTTILLTTQYLDEAEVLADRIAILHDGKILVNGTFEELKKFFPPTKKEYIEKQPTLEEIFLAIIKKEKEAK
jgi:ABC-2 type transport system ATP-binding protein